METTLTGMGIGDGDWGWGWGWCAVCEPVCALCDNIGDDVSFFLSGGQ